MTKQALTIPSNSNKASSNSSTGAAHLAAVRLAEEEGGPFGFGGGGGGPFGGGGFNFGGGQPPPPPRPPPPLELVTAESLRGFLDEAAKSKRSVVLLFAPQDAPLVKVLETLKKQDELKTAKFGQVVADAPSHPLAAKFKLKGLPAVLLTTRGEPTKLRPFKGRLEADALETAISIATRSTTRAADTSKPPPPKGRDLVALMSGDTGERGFVDACLSGSGVCFVLLVRDKREMHVGRGGARRGGGQESSQPAVRVLERVAERIVKGKTNKKLQVKFFWVNVEQFPRFPAQFEVPGSCSDGRFKFSDTRSSSSESSESASPSDGEESGSESEPISEPRQCEDNGVTRGEATMVAVLAKKRRFAAFQGRVDKNGGSLSTIEFDFSVSGLSFVDYVLLRMSS
mmetsp:Transcript_45281/g.120415  ORF Transcript_45281/g.120415 Transcript_45281/m.120415 type:complete len:399 (+) Transcript_45281:281-1477(+)